ncbi:MAG: hypothetical protein C0412_19815 [Flavobacterium sp.]|nr:hypothetical protein [Flavobacterium sp.]
MKKIAGIMVITLFTYISSFGVTDEVFATALGLLDNPKDTQARSAVYEIVEAYLDGDAEAKLFYKENLASSDCANEILREFRGRETNIEIPTEDEELAQALQELDLQKQREMDAKDAQIAFELEQQERERFEHEKRIIEEKEKNRRTCEAVIAEVQRSIEEVMQLAQSNEGNVHKISAYVKSHHDLVIAWFDRLAPIFNLSREFPEKLKEELISLGIEKGRVDDFCGKLTDGTQDMDETGWRSREIFSIAWGLKALDSEWGNVLFKGSINENYDTDGGCVAGIINRSFVLIITEIAALGDCGRLDTLFL